MKRITLPQAAKALGAQAEKAEIIERISRGTGVRLEFEAYTPVWTGGFDGRTTPPTAQSIIGVARWLLRAVGPCMSPEEERGREKQETRGPRVFGHLECEHAASLAFGELGNASPVTVRAWVDGAEPLVDHGLLGLLHPVVWLAEKAGLSLSKIYNKIKYSADRSQSGPIDRLKDLIKQEAPCAPKICGKVLDEINDKYKEEMETFARLLDVPRFLQNAMGKTPAELMNLVPLAPGHRLTVEVITRSPEPTQREQRALGLAAASIAVALAVIGVGKGATRGFGRYRLVEYSGDVQGTAKDVLDRVKSIYTSGSNDAATAVSETLELLGKLAENIVGEGIKPSRLLLPRLRDARVISAPLGYDCDHNILDCLRCIGESVVKNEMKRHALGRPMRKPGTDIHTWVLGLPRHNKSGRNPELWTGYFHAPTSVLSDDNTCCGRFHHVSDPLLLEEPRLKSPLIMFPVRNAAILIAPRLCADNGRDWGLLSGLLMGDKVLVHVGKHRGECIRRIPVTEILGSRGRSLPRCCEDDEECPDDRRPGSDRRGRGDPAGITKPGPDCPRRHDHSRLVIAEESVNGNTCDAWDTSLELVKKVLRCKCGSPGNRV